MNSNDLIRRGDVLALKEVITEEFHEHGASMRVSYSVVTVNNINAVPAVSQPMSADYYSRLGKAFLARLSIPQGMSEEEAAEKIIEEWAQEHPERKNEDGE